MSSRLLKIFFCILAVTSLLGCAGKPCKKCGGGGDKVNIKRNNNLANRQREEIEDLEDENDELRRKLQEELLRKNDPLNNLAGNLGNNGLVNPGLGGLGGLDPGVTPPGAVTPPAIPPGAGPSPTATGTSIDTSGAPSRRNEFKTSLRGISSAHGDSESSSTGRVVRRTAE